ncbi:Uma2 family endonuclease [Nocardia mexicana]|uniref:Uma2 family endonuclease n=1 Tax=Nocardia mexicana TaxID=279262 RepID=A0A370H0N9_9NOCA|nr:Uma2 family endonuclease [Nocardia mexicana]RDI49119.1 Uma2 family endonuclease [Nocardia mexicana]
MTAENLPCAAGFGPYTVLDLHDLPEDGKGYELEDGWLIEMAAGARHNYIGWSLAGILRSAASDTDVFVCDGGEWEVSTPSGVRKPDVFVIPKDVARAAIIDESPKLIPGAELLLVVEVISPGSASERTDRVRKVREYAALGIPQYWLIEHQSATRIHRAVLNGGDYDWQPVVAEGTEFAADVEADKTFRVTFDPGALLEF